MMVLGLTGNLASGKSEVARILNKMGASVMDADEVARRLTRKGTPLYGALVKLFGKQYLGKGGQFDRRKLAWHVFSSPKDLRKLNIITHPSVILEAYHFIEAHKHKKGMIVLSVPLLFESHMEKLVDRILVVASTESAMLERVERRGVPRELAKKILKTQWPMAKKIKRADYVILNNGTLKQLEARVKQFYKETVINEKI